MNRSFCLSSLHYTDRIPKIQKLDRLQALRAIAFIMIFMSHTGLTFFRHCGEWGVSVFIILSGFLMIYNYAQKTEIVPDTLLQNGSVGSDAPFKNPFRFSIGKIKKLYPLHIMMLGVGILVNHSRGKLIAVTLLPHIALLQILIPNEDLFACINGVSWYLSLCLFLYFAFPFLLLFMKKHGSVRRILLLSLGLLLLEFILAWTVTSLIAEESMWFSWKWFLYYCPFTRVIDFALGCNLGYLFLYAGSARSAENDRMTVPYSLLEIAALALWGFSFFFEKFPGYHFSAIPVIPSCFLVYLFASGEGLISKALSNKAFLYVGNLSPYTFLIHSLILTVCRKVFARFGIPAFGYILFAFILTLLLAAVYEKADRAIRKKRA